MLSEFHLTLCRIKTIQLFIFCSFGPLNKIVFFQPSSYYTSHKCVKNTCTNFLFNCAKAGSIQKRYVSLFHLSGLMVSKAYIISVIICTPENKVISVLNHVSDTSSSDLSNWLFCCSFTPSLDPVTSESLKQICRLHLMLLVQKSQAFHIYVQQCFFGRMPFKPITLDISPSNYWIISLNIMKNQCIFTFKILGEKNTCITWNIEKQHRVINCYYYSCCFIYLFLCVSCCPLKAQDTHRQRPFHQRNEHVSYSYSKISYSRTH